MRALLLATAAVGAVFGGAIQNPGGPKVLGERPLDPARKAGVVHPEPPIYRLEDDGTPVLSEVGFLQLADEGPGFYYGAKTQDLAEWAGKIGMLGTNNWGDVEALCIADRVVDVWRARHPQGPRLGLDEISARWGGYPDYDKDGASDHKTHQTGMNVNFLVPCKTRPERHIHLGVRNEELFDPVLYREMIDLLVDEGAFRMTTSAALRAIDAAAELPPTKHRWKQIEKDAAGYSTTYALDGAPAPVRLYLLAGKSDHGDHVNTLLWKGD
jgi:hypothetical protein